jgi:DNA-directed RNA polymerase
VLRTPNRDTQAAAKHAIKEGTMQPALDALNALQAVPFKINTKVLDVLKGVRVMVDLKLKGIVPNNLPVPEKLTDFQKASMEEAQQRFYNLKRDEKRKTNSGYRGDRVMFATDLKIADEMAKHDRFYTAMNLDWRGRVYALPSFNFQREDRVRALFLFADGMPIGEEGLWYLKMHTANVGYFRVSVAGATNGSKISKRPLEERVKWCDDNIQLITNIASAPLVHTEWMSAGKPFLFLAACFELSAALEQGTSYITHLPTSYDGSCSGLQHLCAMTRAAEGSLVNLTSSTLPQDVYQMVANDAYAQIERDLNHEPDPKIKDPEAAAKQSKDYRAMARLFLGFNGDRRDIAKRNVMTYSYSSKKYGMADQQQTDLMEPLARQVLEGTLEDHPFAGYCHGPYNEKGEKQPSKAARYIARRVFEAIETRIKKPAEAMKFLQSIAKAMAHEGKPVRWTTPVGIPWINRYNPPVTSRVSLYLVEGGVKSHTRINLTTGVTKEIDKDKAANGVAPNFVHALDGSHLLLVANASVREGLTSLATVHDSFGCLAPQAARFNQIIREQFALMYEKHDVLTEILEQASCDLTPANQKRLPKPITPGPLNVKDILNADFAFA